MNRDEEPFCWSCDGLNDHQPWCPEIEPLACLERDSGDCEGPVEWHSTDPGVRPAFPRCAFHWALRCGLEDRLRRDYPDSPMAPSWFDPANAGERWDDDY